MSRIKALIHEHRRFCGVLAICFVVAALGFGVLWYRYPAGNYEPVTFLLSTLAVLIGIPTVRDMSSTHPTQSSAQNNPQIDQPKLARITTPPQGEITFRFIDDLIPDDDSILSGIKSLANGDAAVRVVWPPLNDKLFEKATTLRPKLQAVLLKKGVRPGDEMNSKLRDYEAPLDTAQHIRECASVRIRPMWNAMQKKFYWEHFTVPALRHYLALADLATLTRLHVILHEAIGMNPSFHEINPSLSGPESQVLGHSTIRRILGVESTEVFWTVRIYKADLEAYPYIHVHAPRSTVLSAWQTRARGKPVGSGFVHRFLIPQVEVYLLCHLPLKDLQFQVNYSDDNFEIRKVLNEKFEELSISQLYDLSY